MGDTNDHQESGGTVEKKRKKRKREGKRRRWDDGRPADRQEND